MKIKTLHILILILISIDSLSQKYEVEKSKLLEYLNNQKNSIDFINSNIDYIVFKPILSESDLKKKFDRQMLIKSQNKLILIPEGTGMVLQATASTAKTILFTRIDSSLYDGYNFRAINFMYKDTLYSFGGYGFWKNNGQLRYFSNNEWLIQPISKEIFGPTDITYLDVQNGNLFYLSTEYENQAERNSKANMTNVNIVKLNLTNKENTISGKIKNEFGNIILDGKSIWNSASLNGIVVRYNQKVILLDFLNNRIYNSKTSKIFNHLFANEQHEPNFIFENHDTVYYVRSNDIDSLYHFSVNRSDFESEGIQFYTPTESTNGNRKKLFWVMGICLILGCSWLIIRKKISKQTTPNSNPINTYSNLNDTSSDVLKFNEFENHIIEAIIKEKILTVESINHILGLSKKSLEIQKKSRNDVIHRINHKFKILGSVDQDFIERIRSEEDKRYFKYHINKQNEQIYINLIKNHTASQK